MCRSRSPLADGRNALCSSKSVHRTFVHCMAQLLGHVILSVAKNLSERPFEPLRVTTRVCHPEWFDLVRKDWQPVSDFTVAIHLSTLSVVRAGGLSFGKERLHAGMNRREQMVSANSLSNARPLEHHAEQPFRTRNRQYDALARQPRAERLQGVRRSCIDN